MSVLVMPCIKINIQVSCTHFLQVRDLLGKDAKKRLELHEHPEKGVYVQGLSMHKVSYYIVSVQSIYM